LEIRRPGLGPRLQWFSFRRSVPGGARPGPPLHAMIYFIWRVNVTGAVK